MAKKKLNVSSESRAAVGPSAGPSEQAEGKKPAGSKPGAAKQPATSAAPTGRKRVLSQDEIGAVAGEVWHALSQGGGQNLTALKKSIDAPGDLVLAATGWLAREGKLEFDTSGRAVKVSLR